MGGSTPLTLQLVTFPDHWSHRVRSYASDCNIVPTGVVPYHMKKSLQASGSQSNNQFPTSHLYQAHTVEHRRLAFCEQFKKGMQNNDSEIKFLAY